jgi:DnaK suppressor protein
MARNDALKKIHDLLITRRDALRKALTGDLSLLKQLRDQPGSDVADAALDTAHEEICSQLAEVESRELLQIERALEKMRENTYGECEVCSTKIPLARLQALPYATMCIKCQRAEELGELDWRREADWDRVVDNSYNEVDISMSDLEI